MSAENNLVIKAGEGSCLTTLGSFLLIPIPLSAWILISNLIVDKTSILRRDLSQSEGLFFFSMFLGFVLHESCQYFAHRLFGGKPQYSNRKRLENRTYLKIKYLFPITIRFWSPNKDFSIIQYLFIVLSPAIINFTILPLAMIYGHNPAFFSAIWIIGFTISCFIPLDLLVAGKILSSAKDGLFVVDNADGTYLVKR
jgi:hypothetical protein